LRDYSPFSSANVVCYGRSLKGITTAEFSLFVDSPSKSEPLFTCLKD